MQGGVVVAKSIPALVTPEVLQWARNLDWISVEEIAQKLNVTVEKIYAWECGSEYPSLAQAKKLAKQYRVPFAFFYLPDTPKKKKRLDKVDYRTFGNWEITDVSREFRWFLRDIEDRRDSMLELYEKTEKKVRPFKEEVSMNISEELFATQIREYLGLTKEIQYKFRKPEKALSYCSSKLEEKDFLIFQAAKINPNEMRGLSISYEDFPIIALNRKDEYSARLFTLVHELVHIFTRTSGICNDINQDIVTQNQVELFCNKVAGCALVPRELLMQNKWISLIREHGLEDIYVNALARDFAVSREVILHRLWDVKMINRETYFSTLKRYSEEYLQYKNNKKNGGYIPPAIDKGTQMGKLYTKTVISAFNSDILTPRETSNYLLGLGVKHFEAIEKWCY